MPKIKIFHNPRCSKSRKTLEILHQLGHKPEVIKYLETPPSVESIKQILTLLKIKPQELLRKNEVDYKQNNMDDKALSDSVLIQFMHDFPKIIERPIVLNEDRAIIARPPELVLNIL